uniref:Pyrin domain-containing protein n=1 Tax=Maylandia zebra TaxID=106582 RepID=A0A3P9DJL3_9CICH
MFTVISSDSVPLQLLEMLDDLGEEQLKRFHFYLQNEPVGDFQTIKKSRLENADRLKTVDVMIQSYSDHAVEVATHENNKINTKVYFIKHVESQVVSLCF